jgi:hypothetical protein
LWRRTSEFRRVLKSLRPHLQYSNSLKDLGSAAMLAINSLQTAAIKSWPSPTVPAGNKEPCQAFLMCRYKADSKVQAGIQSQLDKSDASFKEIERKDIKVREDIKHLKGKLKKLCDKLAKDTVKAEVGGSALPLKARLCPLDLAECRDVSGQQRVLFSLVNRRPAEPLTVWQATRQIFRQ